MKTVGKNTNPGDFQNCPGMGKNTIPGLFLEIAFVELK